MQNSWSRRRVSDIPRFLPECLIPARLQLLEKSKSNDDPSEVQNAPQTANVWIRLRLSEAEIEISSMDATLTRADPTAFQSAISCAGRSPFVVLASSLDGTIVRSTNSDSLAVCH